MNTMINGKYVGAWRWQHRAAEEVFSKAHRVFLDALNVVGTVTDKHRSLTSSGQFTTAGVQAELTKWLEHEGGANIARGRVELTRIKRELEKRREKVSIQGPDKTDVAGALLRQEIRGYIRGLDAAKRTAMLMDPAVSSEVALSIIEAPAELSGVSNELREQLVNRALEALHPEEIKEIAEVEEAVQIADNALRAAHMEVQSTVKLGSRELDAILDGTKFVKLHRVHETSEATGWKPKEVIKVHDPEKRITRTATPDEIANGYYVERG